jgi:hypothetical protein
MLLRDIEVVNNISQMIIEREDPGAGTDRKLEVETPLVILAARLHAGFHDALPNRTAVAETGEMPDSVKHQASKADSIG